MKVVVRIGMDEATVTIKAANEDKTAFRGVDYRGSIYQFNKSQIVRRISDDNESD